MKIKIKGIKEAQKKLGNLEKKAIQFIDGEALRDVGEKIGEISKARVPFVSGRLRNSFTTIKLGDKWACGYNTEYAAKLHQAGDGWQWSEPGTGPLYLSGPVTANEKQLLQFFAERFETYLKTIT